MGEKLMKYYKHVGDEGGLKAKMRLATMTKIPSANAALEPDSQENIELFTKAVTEITGKSAPTF